MAHLEEGTDAYPAAADRAEDWSAREPVSFLLQLQKYFPKGPFVSGLVFLSLSLLAPPLPPPKHSKLLLSSSRILLLVVITLWQCSHIREQESEIALPFILGYLQVFPLTFIPSSFLQSLCNSRLFFHLEKPDIVEDLKSEMSLTWLPCLLVKLQSFLC